MKKQNEIGFNNFKSFGDKLQIFSHKPITLIYGPNSIGKSSLLHFLLYVEYIKKAGDLNLEKSDFAGDPIDLGGFSNFIHQKNTNAKIAYHLTFQKGPEIDQYFSPLYTLAKDFEKQGSFQNKIQVSDIEARVETYRKKNKDALIIFSDMVRNYKGYKNQPENLPSCLKDALEESRKTNLHDFVKFNARILLKKSHREESEWVKSMWDAIELETENWPLELINLEKRMENSLESFEPFDSFFERKDNQPFDGLDKLILFLLDYKKMAVGKKYEEFFNLYRLMDRIKDIKKVKIEFEFGHRSKKNQIGNYEYFIDDELIYTYDSKSKSICQKDESDVLMLLKESGLFMMDRSRLFEIEKLEYQKLIDRQKTRIFFDILIPENIIDFIMSHFRGFQSTEGQFFKFKEYDLISKSIHERIILNLKTGINNEGSQYFGPLRYYPKRFDMIEQNFDTHELGDTKFNTKKVSMISKIAFDMMLKSPGHLKRMWMLYYWGLVKDGWKQVVDTPSVADCINFFRSPLKKKSCAGSMSSDKIWAMLIKSTTSLNRINQWLSNNSLKLPYIIRIEQDQGKVRKGIWKFFRLEPLKKLTFIDQRNDTEVTPREMGLGVSQFLPILVATQVLKNFKLFIEQPELHLHPAIQCEIADEMIRSMRNQGNEFIVESHSEHLLLRIMKRMRQTSEGCLDDESLALIPDDVCLIFVDNNGKMTYVNELELDEDGSLLDPWPNGFFEEGFKERFF